jgi:hypothetical protein
VKQSWFGPDGQWVGDRPTVEAPVQPPTAAVPSLVPPAVAHTWSVLQVAVGLALLVPFALLTFFALAAGLSPALTTATATVTAVGPGEDGEGPRDHCFTLEYRLDDEPVTAYTCELRTFPRLVTPLGATDARHETHEEAERRFVAEHPVGSTVQLLHEVESPHRARSVATPGSNQFGGSPALAAGFGIGAVLCLTGTVLALRSAWRRTRRLRRPA